MKNQETSWIIVRAFGIYFLVHAILEILSIFYNLVNVASLYAILDTSSDAASIEFSIMRSWANLPGYIIKLVIFGLLSFYCLRKGKIIHRLLTYKPSADDET